MDARQLGFGWTIEDHRDRDQRLCRIYLPRSITVEDGSVAEDKVRFLLHRLNHHAQGDRECNPSVETLAAEMGVEEKTVRRTIKAAARLGLLKVDRKKAQLVCNHYAIDWDAVKTRGVRLSHPELAERPDNMTGTDRTYVPVPNGHEGATDRTLVPVAPDRPDIRTGTDRTLVPATMVMVNGYQEPPPSARAGDGGGSLMIWGTEIKPEDLFDDEKFDVLFGLVVRCDFAKESEEERGRFAALVINIRRAKVANRIGLLTRVIEGKIFNKFVPKGANPRDWRNRATDADRDEARRMLKRLDGIGEARPATPADAAYERDAAPHQEKGRQIDELRKAFQIGGPAR